METITQQQALKAVQSGLATQTTALQTQQVMLFGADGTPNGKCALSTDAVIDLRSGKTLAEVIEYNRPSTSSDLYVDMGLPSGLLWAKANIDVTTASGFTEVDGQVSPYAYDCSFFSWGNTDAHNPTSASSFSPYTWGSANDQEPYASSAGAKIAYPGSAGPSYDAARANLGAPWRMPTTAEFAELFANIEYVTADGDLVDTTNNVSKNAESNPSDKRVTVNGIVGLLLRSKINGNPLFFPASGLGNGTSRVSRAALGYYWSSSLYSATHGRHLYFSASGVYPQNTNYRFYGFAARPVQ